MKKAKETKKTTKILPKTTSEKVLTIIFILLVILVIILTFVAINKKKEYKEKQADIVIPITEVGTNNVLNVDISNLKENDLKDYKFKITNYRDKKINNSVTSYSIIIDNNKNDVVLKLYKTGSENDLLKDKDDYKLTNLTLKQKKKQMDNYTLIIKAIKSIKTDKNITIKIISENWQPVANNI